MGKKKKSVVRYDDKYYDEILNKNRLIYLYDDIDDASAELVNKKLVAMHLRKKKKPVTIEINSPGGYCTQGFSIVDTIKRLKNSGTPVYTIITGNACSMGSIISVVGSKRFITENAYYMMHPMAGGANDYFPYVLDRVEFMKTLNNKLIKIYEDNTNVPEVLIQKCRNGEVWLNAEECLKYGVVDKIL